MHAWSTAMIISTIVCCHSYHIAHWSTANIRIVSEGACNILYIII
jgi:hypothetical protein